MPDFEKGYRKGALRKKEEEIRTEIIDALPETLEHETDFLAYLNPGGFELAIHPPKEKENF